jgi:hypothetical protein
MYRGMTGAERSAVNTVGDVAADVRFSQLVDRSGIDTSELGVGPGGMGHETLLEEPDVRQASSILTSWGYAAMARKIADGDKGLEKEFIKIGGDLFDHTSWTGTVYKKGDNATTVFRKAITQLQHESNPKRQELSKQIAREMFANMTPAERQQYQQQYRQSMMGLKPDAPQSKVKQGTGAKQDTGVKPGQVAAVDSGKKGLPTVLPAESTGSGWRGEVTDVDVGSPDRIRLSDVLDETPSNAPTPLDIVQKFVLPGVKDVSDMTAGGGVLGQLLPDTSGMVTTRMFATETQPDIESLRNKIKGFKTVDDLQQNRSIVERYVKSTGAGVSFDDLIGSVGDNVKLDSKTAAGQFALRGITAAAQLNKYVQYAETNGIGITDSGRMSITDMGAVLAGKPRDAFMSLAMADAAAAESGGAAGGGITAKDAKITADNAAISLNVQTLNLTATDVQLSAKVGGGRTGTNNVVSNPT